MIHNSRKRKFKKLAKAVIISACNNMHIKNRLNLREVRFVSKNTNMSFAVHSGKNFILYDLNNIYNNLKNEDDLFYDILFDVLHECRHYFQFLQVNSLTPEVDKKTIKTWKKEILHYYNNSETYSQYKKYVNQNIEVDANLYASLILLKNFSISKDYDKHYLRKLSKHYKKVYLDK